MSFLPLIQILHTINSKTWWESWSIFALERGKQFIAVRKFGATWADNKNKFMITFDKTSLKLAISFFLDNHFFSFSKFSFWQIIGIPKCSDPAPFIANLFLYYYERKWLLDTKIKDLHIVHIFSNTFRFVEDLSSTNNHLEFDRNFKSMYTFQLQKHHF